MRYVVFIMVCFLASCGGSGGSEDVSEERGVLDGNSSATALVSDELYDIQGVWVAQCTSSPHELLSMVDLMSQYTRFRLSIELNFITIEIDEYSSAGCMEIQRRRRLEGSLAFEESVVLNDGTSAELLRVSFHMVPETRVLKRVEAQETLYIGLPATDGGSLNYDIPLSKAQIEDGL